MCFVEFFFRVENCKKENNMHVFWLKVPNVFVFTLRRECILLLFEGKKTLNSLKVHNDVIAKGSKGGVLLKPLWRADGDIGLSPDWEDVIADIIVTRSLLVK